MSEPTRSPGAGRHNRGRSGGSGVWSWSVALATAIGLICAIISWGLSSVVLSVIVLTSVAAVIAASAWAEDGRRAVPRILRAGFGAGLAAPAAVGLIAVLKLAGVLLVLALVVTTPAVSSFLRARRDAKGGTPDARSAPSTGLVPVTSFVGGPAVDPVVELDSLDDEALCLAWRRSFRRLEAAVTMAERLAVVAQRQRYLDELDRRSPDGVAAWLAAGARASGNPLPYVADRRRQAD
ncbi:hypothetical protein [Kribbella sp. NPDC003557]|uniref:hypothetical protein n=1 Tax=Kribbella sp. NPDC003557 TaxID=3154449 RepID=UPI0033A13136